MTAVAWFEIVVGVGIAALWTMLLATGQVPEIPAGRRDIWFHIAAEVLTAALLVAAGAWWLVAASSSARALSTLALGALLYTTINSPGYYADEGNWPPVGMFAVLTGVTAIAGAVAVVGA